MAAGRHLGFSKFRISDEIFKFVSCQSITSYAVQISAKKLNPCGSYYHFGKSKMAAAAILDFHNFVFFYNCHVYIVFLHIPVQFGDNRSMHAKMASRYSLRFFALKMPNHAPFWALFGVKHS